MATGNTLTPLPVGVFPSNGMTPLMNWNTPCLPRAWDVLSSNSHRYFACCFWKSGKRFIPRGNDVGMAVMPTAAMACHAQNRY